MYIFLLFVHVTAAVVGLGAAFAFPMIAKSAKTVSEAKFTLSLLKKLEILPKLGSIILFITGLIMGFIHPWLFTAGWFIASIVIYLAVQVIVAGLLPKNMKKQMELLQKEDSETLPQEYVVISNNQQN